MCNSKEQLQEACCLSSIGNLSILGFYMSLWPPSAPQSPNLQAGQMQKSPLMLSLTLHRPRDVLFVISVSLECKKRKNQTAANRENCKTTASPGTLVENCIPWWNMRCISAELKASPLPATFTVTKPWQTQQVFHILMQRQSEMLPCSQVFHFTYVCFYTSHTCTQHALCTEYF